MSRTRLITSSSFAGSLGWGMILPFQYAYVVDARGWGALVGMLTGTVFCLGAVVAAPLAGRLTDRYSAGHLAIVFPLVAAVSDRLGLGWPAATSFLAAMAVFGAAITAPAPPTQVLILEAVPPSERRSVFAYQFTAMALGMAVGAFAAGQVIDLEQPDGMWPAFARQLGFAVTAAFLRPPLADVSADRAEVSATSLSSSRGRDTLTTDGRATAGRPTATWPGTVRFGCSALASIALAAGFYAQFDTGLPAFALQSLSVEPSVIGTAAAVNCVVIVGLQWLVVRVTKDHSGAGLLVVVATIWATAGCCSRLPCSSSPHVASTLFVVAFAIFAVGETMYAPILSPLTAAVAPPGLVGTTLGALGRNADRDQRRRTTGGRRAAGARPPARLRLPHVVINAVAIVLALRLVRMQTVAATSSPAPSQVARTWILWTKGHRATPAAETPSRACSLEETRV